MTRVRRTAPAVLATTSWSRAPAMLWIALAATAACAGGRDRADRADRVESASVGDAHPRRVVSPPWDTLWTRGGGAQDDTLLLMPWALAADSARVYVLDAAAYRLVAFRASDGSVAWISGRKGGGPGEFAGPTAIATLPAGGVAVADPRNSRITVLDTAGHVIRELRLASVSDARSMCALADGSLLLATAEDDQPLVLMTVFGRVYRRLALPWADLTDVPPLARQARLAATPDHASCVLALELGRGFATFDGTRFTAPHRYVEFFDLPSVEVRRTLRSRTQRVLERRIAAYDVAADGGEIAAAFEGRTAAGRRLIDLYDLRSGAYLRSYVLEASVSNLARWGGRYYLVAEREGYPVLLALEERASGARTEPTPRRPSRRAVH